MIGASLSSQRCFQELFGRNLAHAALFHKLKHRNGSALIAYDLRMTGSKIKSRKRAPRLPGHLLSKDSFTTSPGSPDNVSDRPCSPTSSVDTASVLDLDDQLSEASHMGTRTGFTRLTQSPLMHSAIVQGTAPKARVKNSAVGHLGPTIKSVLGFGGLPPTMQQQDLNLRASRSRSCASGPQPK